MAEPHFCDLCLQLANLLADCAASLAEEAAAMEQFVRDREDVVPTAAKLKLERSQKECEDLKIQLKHHCAEHLMQP
ncbi:MAG: hypothetical protein JOY62_05865 [Acidobacteriaceae bacterium]|nr:hypothetical protein [Acidobacteriaceae bacterium]MBV9779485.1 hypothetical protein [Acidobacteriaceae bacterium]